jgi:hypothetical protein
MVRRKNPTFKIISLSVLVIGLALGIVGVSNAQIFKSKAYDPLQFEYTDPRGDPTVGDEEAEKLERAENPGARKTLETTKLDDPPVPPVQPGKTVDCELESTSYKDCYTSSFREDTYINGHLYEEGDPILYVNEYEYENGKMVGSEQYGMFFPDLESLTASRNSSTGHIVGVSGTFSNNNPFNFNVSGINDIVSQLNAGRSSETQIPPVVSVFDFLNRLSINEGTGDYQFCTGSSGYCINKIGDILKIKGFDQTVANLENTIMKVDNSATGGYVPVGSYTPLGGCKGCGERYSKPGQNGGGGGGNSSSTSFAGFGQVSGDINSLKADQFLYIVNKLPAMLRDSFLKFLGWVDEN